MAKIGMYTDTHFCEYKSVVNRKSETSKYSDRLDSAVKSIHWMYDTFKENDVDVIINAGDLLDKPSLNSLEITALVDAYSKSYGVEEYHVVGNHETLDNTSKINSANILSLFSDLSNQEVISDITLIDKGHYNLLLIPYLPNFDNNYLLDILESTKGKDTIVVSHNYYIGIDYGPFEVSEGIDYNLIKSYNFDVFNGHIHNSLDFGNYHQIGAMLGSTFGDVYDVSTPSILIFDTVTREISRIKNPYSHLFYKLEFKDMKSLDEEISNLSTDKNPLCIRVSSSLETRDDVREYLDSVKEKYNIYYSEVMAISSSNQGLVEEDREDLSIDSYESAVDKLSRFILSVQDDRFPVSKSRVLEFIREEVLS